MRTQPIPRKILAIKLRPLGSTLLMTAALDELQRAYPHSRIDIAVLTQWSSLFEDHPAVTKVWSFDRYPERVARAKSVARLGFRLRKEKYDCVINFHASPSSSSLALATGAKRRVVHFHAPKDRNRYSTIDIPGKGEIKSILEKDLDCLRALGLRPRKDRQPRIRPSEDDRQNAKAYLDRHPSTRPRLFLGLGADRPTKIWPMKHFSQLAIQWLRSNQGSCLAIIGAGQQDLLLDFLRQVDEQLAEKKVALSERQKIRARIGFLDNVPLRTLAALLEKADVLCGNDSGVRHLAATVGTPTATLFGPEDPVEWHPYPQDRHPAFYRKELDCRDDALEGMAPWCDLDECVAKKHACMRGILVDPVLEACQEIAKA